MSYKVIHVVYLESCILGTPDEGKEHEEDWRSFEDHRGKCAFRRSRNRVGQGKERRRAQEDELAEETTWKSTCQLNSQTSNVAL